MEPGWDADRFPNENSSVLPVGNLIVLSNSPWKKWLDFVDGMKYVATDLIGTLRIRAGKHPLREIQKLSHAIDTENDEEEAGPCAWHGCCTPAACPRPIICAESG